MATAYLDSACKATFFADGPFGLLGRSSGQFGASSASGSIRFIGPDVFCDPGWTAIRQR